MGMDVDFIAAKDSIKELESLLLDTPHGEREKLSDNIIDFVDQLKNLSKDKSIKWKYVFNTSIREERWNGIKEAIDTARVSGYKFFLWNGYIYTIDGYKTELTEENCY